MIEEIYGSKGEINYLFLREKVIERFGERDISFRSLRNVLATLAHYGVLKKTGPDNYKWKRKLKVSDMNVCFMLKLYADEFKKSPQVNLTSLEPYLFLYFEIPDVNEIGQKYNNRLWEYKVRFGEKLIQFHEGYDWDIGQVDGLFKTAKKRKK